jgi:hypothetical protein
MLTGLLRPTLGSSSQRQNSNVFARELATEAIYVCNWIASSYSWLVLATTRQLGILETTHRVAVRAVSVVLRIDEGRTEVHVIGVIHTRVGTRRPVVTAVSDTVGGNIGVTAVASRRELEGFGDAEVRLRRS